MVSKLKLELIWMTIMMRRQQSMASLTKMKVNFFQVELIMHRSGDEDEDAEPENCAAPLTCKEKVSSLKRV